MPVISIIVPIYNVEPYLAKCLDSILAQTHTNFELILVNDGSQDKCGEVCDYYAEKDNRVRVIHKRNGGVSSARNKGIESAKGDYLAFIDPDDTVEPNMYEELIKSAIKYEPDIVVCPIKTINLKNNSISVSNIWKQVDEPLNKKNIIGELIPSLLRNETYSLVSCFNKLYKKEIFDLNNVWFDEQKSHSEDVKLNFTLLTLINKLVYIELPLYNYFIHNKKSLTNVFREDLYNYILDNKKLLIQICNKYNYEKYIDNVKNHYMNVTIVYMQEVVNGNIPFRGKDRILSEILNDKEFKIDIISYKCPSYYYKLLKSICILKNEKAFQIVVTVKCKLQHFIGRLA